jgi:hypothetical protein
MAKNQRAMYPSWYSIATQRHTTECIQVAARSISHLLHLCRYVHGNPVKDGLVAAPVAWPYSNYREWIGEGTSLLMDRSFIEEQFSNLEEYKKFLTEYLNTFHLPNDVQKHISGLER